MYSYYYNQADPRWANKMYSSTNNKSQTMKSSGCGPAAAAMIISNLKESVLPDEMADYFMGNGLRSPSSGTYWSAFSWISKKWNIEFKQTSNIEDALTCLRNGGMAVVSCQDGLFTTNGHFIVLAGINADTLVIYDSYLYQGKYDITNRKGKVTVQGTNIYCNINNFKQYGNIRQYFCYYPDKNSTQDITKPTTITSTVGQTKTFTKTAIIYEKSNLTGIQYSYLANTTVQILENLSSTIDKVKSIATGRVGYVSNIGLYKTNSSTVVTKKSTAGQVKVFKNNTIIYANSNLTGTKYSYLPNTTVQILENTSSTIDKVKSKITGRIGYVSNNVYK